MGVLAALLLAPHAVHAQSRLIQARARIDATVPERIRVEVDYLLQVVGEGPVDRGDEGGDAGVPEVDEVEGRVQEEGGALSIPLEGIAFRPTSLESVTAALDGVPVGLSIEVSDARRIVGHVALPPGHTGRITLRVSYDVTSGFQGDDPYLIRIPMLAVGWAAAEARPGVFSAEVLLAAELKVFESFPSDLSRLDEAGATARFRLDLPAVPALISLRATTGRIPFGGLVRIMDGMVLVILAVTAVLGFRYLRGTA